MSTLLGVRLIPSPLLLSILTQLSQGLTDTQALVTGLAQELSLRAYGPQRTHS